MLYQLSYALKPHYQVSTFAHMKIAFGHRQSKLLLSLAFAMALRDNSIRILFLTLLTKSIDGLQSVALYS
jgi:hypothetical protein